MLRRTKIVATLGPATDSPESLAAIIAAGVDVTRLNFSHGSAEDHIERARRVRETAKSQGRFVALLADLQGPKLRIARFADNKITVQAGQTFVLDAAMDKAAGDETRVGIDYEQLIQDVVPGDILVLDDGRIEMEVEEVNDHSISSRVLIGGPLSNNKGLNKRGGGLSADALTEKDKQDIKTAAALGADYVAVSFVRTADDMHTARALLREAGSDAALVAKIERAELAHNLEQLDAVIEASDAVMVARGDLAVEIGDAELVGIQKHIINRARSLDRVVITATQMMESMIDNPMPTRAEVSDVANAVMDYTDAVMLSAETAVGDYPKEAVDAMVRICLGAEKQPSMHQSKHRIHESMERVDEAIALSAMYAANHLEGVAAIICLTETGATPLLMSRIKSSLPIFAFSRHHSTQHKVALYRGVQTVPFDSEILPNETINARAVDELVERGVAKEGDLVVVTKGDYVNAQGGTNTMKIVRVGSTIQ
ncbi:pyruvate kinase [Marinobacter nanhaiticus D15-8W]|uniref:Pyruvate kinase n=1 Tax=Marinobacter nanhaiticus D15-8W TaxID=626887 RepID=N6WRK0_9GAMM|nr:pyruvate kinase [Marinobacter nanhaiticus]ENO13662.1 pyruvate kinase [Marinobacter nanhaiticus D15-8W]BES71033.1 pyruvate kinase [Marinobacter nanhaiticus D15-8W]